MERKIKITHRTYRAVRRGSDSLFQHTVQTRKNREMRNELDRLALELKAKGAPTK